MASPFAPPPVSATTSILPPGNTRDTVWRRISTTSTEPSAIATGPSGNIRPSATTSKSLISGRRLAEFGHMREIEIFVQPRDLAVLDLADDAGRKRHAHAVLARAAQHMLLHEAAGERFQPPLAIFAVADALQEALQGRLVVLERLHQSVGVVPDFDLGIVHPAQDG